MYETDENSHTQSYVRYQATFMFLLFL